MLRSLIITKSINIGFKQGTNHTKKTNCIDLGCDKFGIFCNY